MGMKVMNLFKSNKKSSGTNEFNQEMKSKISAGNLSNLSYCDTTSIVNLEMNKNTTDGLHYTSDLYKSIYNKIVSDCIK